MVFVHMLSSMDCFRRLKLELVCCDMLDQSCSIYKLK